MAIVFGQSQPSFLSAFGTGLAQGIPQATADVLGSIRKRQEIKKNAGFLESLFPNKGEQLANIAASNPQLAQQYIKEAFKAQQQAPFIQALTEKYGPDEANRISSINQVSPSLAQAYIQQIQQKNFAEELFGPQSSAPTSPDISNNVPTNIETMPSNIQNEPNTLSNEASWIPKIQHMVKPSRLNAKTAASFTPNQISQIQSKESAEENKVKDRIAKEDAMEQRAHSEAKKEAKRAKTFQFTLDQVKSVVDSPRLNSPLKIALVEGLGKMLGVDLEGALLSSDTRELKKAGVEWAKSAKEIFGARPAVYDVQLLMRSAVDPKNDPNLNKRLVAFAERLNDITFRREELYRQIEEANDNILPKGSESAVEKRLAPEIKDLNKVYDELLSDLRKMDKEGTLPKLPKTFTNEKDAPLNMPYFDDESNTYKVRTKSGIQVITPNEDGTITVGGKTYGLEG